MDALLKTKHWIWFVLIVVGPLVAAFFIMRDSFSFMVEAVKLKSVQDVEQFQAEFFSGIFPKMKWVALTSIPIYVWLLSVNIGLRKYVPENAKPSNGKFLIAFSMFAVFQISSLLYLGEISGGPVEIMEKMSVLNLLQLPMLAASIWLFLLTAKIIKSAELQREAKIDDYAVNILLIFFLFVGIWMIQPKLNKIANGETLSSDS